jgi:predicted unusual protein kinase regulating ubiquinone biosynthesis (AarF/ABC1/UbiB family)
VRDDGTVNLMDFGCIRVFDAGFVKGVIDLYNALCRDDRDLAVHAYEGWGFRNLTAEVIEVLNRWARFVYAPLMEDRVKKITDTGLYGREVAESVHRDLKSIGGVRPPREFVFMDRAAIGLGSVFVHLKAELNWHRLFHELIDGFDEATVRSRQRAALAEAGVPLPG